MGRNTGHQMPFPDIFSLSREQWVSIRTGPLNRFLTPPPLFSQIC